MIKNIFLPEQLHNNYLFGQNQLGLEINKTAITATLVHVTGTNAIIKEFFTEPITKNEGDPEQNTIDALKNLFRKTGKNVHVHLTLANNSVIFKELVLPFLEYEQIQQVLPFELESQIPFAVKDILFDFIITRQDKAQKKSTILIGIATQKDVDYYTLLIEKAGQHLHAITIDLLSFYGLYTVNPQYKQAQVSAILLDVGLTNTTIAYVQQQQLVNTRTINQGLASLAKNIADKTGDTASQVIDFILRFGFTSTDKPAFNDAIEQELASFAQQIQFTLNAFSTQIANYQLPQRIVVISRGAQIQHLEAKLSTLLSLPVEFFDIQALLTVKNIKLANNTHKLPLSNLLSLGAAYPFTPVGLFNILAHQKTPAAVSLLQKQLFAAALVIFVFLTGIVAYSYLQYSLAHKHVSRAKKSALDVLSQEFEISERNLNSAVESAQQKVDDAEQIWEGISGQSRPKFLKYLQELSVKIDRDGVGLDLQKLTMSKQSITLKGQVRDYTALKTIEEELRDSKLFELGSIPQDTTFEIKLAIKHTNEESS